VVGHGHDGPGDRAAPAVAQVADELPVDLECVQRERVQVGQRRVAGAEVVEGDQEAEFVQFGESPRGAAQVLDQQALGDLQLEALGRDAGLGQDA
jgi:hypothetical protein